MLFEVFPFAAEEGRGHGAVYECVEHQIAVDPETLAEIGSLGEARKRMGKHEVYDHFQRAALPDFSHVDCLFPHCIENRLSLGDIRVISSREDDKLSRFRRRRRA